MCFIAASCVDTMIESGLYANARSILMVMKGKKGYAVKCGACGYEDAVFFREHIDIFKEISLKTNGSKCPKCGETLKVDKSKVITF